LLEIKVLFCGKQDRFPHQKKSKSQIPGSKTQDLNMNSFGICLLQAEILKLFKYNNLSDLQYSKISVLI